MLRNWDSRSKRHSKKPVVTVGLDLSKVRKNKQHLGTKRPNTKIREIVGVDQLTENTGEIHSPTKTDLDLSEILQMSSKNGMSSNSCHLMSEV